VNAYSRFPEYYWFDQALRHYLQGIPSAQDIKVLDVGSPKMFGLYLGQKIKADILLTDISEINIDEYKVMWRALEPGARGKVQFALQDARSLKFPDAAFDLVYSMSVIEHIEGEGGDSQAMRELLRVLKPGGLLAVSVPFSSHYLEQKRIGFSGAARKTGDQEAYFFQRIYDADAFQRQILSQTGGLEQIKLVVVARRNQWLSRGFGKLGENARGALGFLNPLFSVLINHSNEGMNGSVKGSYGPFHTACDVYGDLIFTGRKKQL